ncbi:paraneoplastic antigen Ma6E-like [Tamandua tetradactyla]|uniref:paraneoplastic antigen Ma6E-like n=1 Tax=Tamandua tetradactyla TaxID=48850 RepID=UPI004053B7BE
MALALLRDWCRWMGANAQRSLLILGIPEDCAEEEFQEAVQAALGSLGSYRMLGHVFRKELGTRVALIEFAEDLNGSLVPRKILGRGGPWTVIFLLQVPPGELQETPTVPVQPQGQAVAGRAAESGARDQAGPRGEAEAEDVSGAAGFEKGAIGEVGDAAVEIAGEAGARGEAGAAGGSIADVAGVAGELGAAGGAIADVTGVAGEGAVANEAETKGAAEVAGAAGAAGEAGATGGAIADMAGIAGEGGVASEAEAAGVALADVAGAASEGGVLAAAGSAGEARAAGEATAWASRWRQALYPLLESVTYQELRRFSGRPEPGPGEESFEDWLDHANGMLYLWRQVSEQEKRRRLVECLSGPALHLMCSLLAENPELPAQECLSAFVQVFGNKDTRVTARLKVLTCAQRPQESLFAYVMRLEGLLQAALEKGAVDAAIADQVRARQVLMRARPNATFRKKLERLRLQRRLPGFVGLLRLVRETEAWEAALARSEQGHAEHGPGVAGGAPGAAPAAETPQQDGDAPAPEGVGQAGPLEAPGASAPAPPQVGSVSGVGTQGTPREESGNAGGAGEGSHPEAPWGK